MEVHHHSHASTSLGHRKKWTHYFWEFLMLFLAVFCGFLAENKREHIVEHQREKQYIRSMVEDVSAETKFFDNLIPATQQIEDTNDSLLLELKNPGILTDSKRGYKFWSESDYYIPHIYNDRTIQQLKNSGGLRLIRNKHVSDSIMAYDLQMRHLFASQDRLDRLLLNNVNYTYRLFATMTLNTEKNLPVPLLNTDKKFLEEVYGFRLELKDKIRDFIRNQKQVLNQGTRLIAYIKKEYRLK